MKYSVGVDVGGTFIKIGLLNDKLDFIDKWQIPTIINNPNKLVEAVINSLNEHLNKLNISINNIEKIGFGLPGPTKDDVVIKCPNMGWGQVELKEIVKPYLPSNIKVSLGNDANVAALGEYAKSEKKLNSLVLITLGTGVGGGIIYNGKMIEGATGAGGEIGHIKADTRFNYLCSCGLYGCIETIASATGIVRIAKDLMNEFPNSSLKEIADLTAKDVMDAAKENDPLGLEVLDIVSDRLGMVIAKIAVTVNPEAFVIGGGVSKAGDILLNNVKKAFDKYSHYSVKNTIIEIAKLGNDAGMIGAASLN